MNSRVNSTLGDYVSVLIYPGEKCTILVTHADNWMGLRYACAGAGGTGQMSAPSCQFCCKPKTALKKTV